MGLGDLGYPKTSGEYGGKELVKEKEKRSKEETQENSLAKTKRKMF